MRPARHRIADDRFRSGPYHKRLFQLGVGIGDQPALPVRDQAVVGDDRHFLGEAFDVVRLTLEIGERDEQGEVGIVVAGGLDPVVEQALDAFPDAVAPRLDDHAPAHAGLFGHLPFGNGGLIPGGEIVFAFDGEGVADVGHDGWALCNAPRPSPHPFVLSLSKHCLS